MNESAKVAQALEKIEQATEKLEDVEIVATVLTSDTMIRLKETYEMLGTIKINLAIIRDSL